MRGRVVQCVSLACAIAALCGHARAQLAQDQVLLVYDSRIADSRDVAEYYAGSRKVPGGTGTERGVRPLVHVLNLANAGVPASLPGNISYANFATNLRSPIRQHLLATNLTRRVRGIVLTKGLPHRVQDTNNPNNADAPTNGTGAFIPELEASDVTSASVDAELTLLWQDLDSGEAGGPGDSRADGVIQNPYRWVVRSLATYDNTNIASTKTLQTSLPAGLGPYWSIIGAGNSPSRLNPGDIYAVTRLDGRTVPGVRAMIQRAQNLHINVATAALLFDEDGADLDASSSVFPTNNGDDYELTVNNITNDGRFRPAQNVAPPNVLYNNLPGALQFFVGPNLAQGVSWNGGIIRPEPVILIASYGANHSGVPTTSAGQGGGTIYATTFNLANGAIFNTIESYNGRDFGGLGQLAAYPQMQAADFLNAGGTFAVCNVWEPLADTIPDNVFLVNNFVLGNLSWAEASWTSIPGLSWMQMSVGEPLARVTRSSEDFNANQRVTADDVYLWQALPAGDLAKDVNRSGTADTTDRGFIINSARAAERVNIFAGR